MSNGFKPRGAIAAISIFTGGWLLYKLYPELVKFIAFITGKFEEASLDPTDPIGFSASIILVAGAFFIGWIINWFKNR